MQAERVRADNAWGEKRTALIGDGRITYEPERILETYYALSLWKGGVLTFDYQNLTNVAHNVDRGPVHVFAGRFHAEF